MGQTWVVVAIILVGLALAWIVWYRGEAAAARQTPGAKAGKKPAGAAGEAKGKAETPGSEQAPSGPNSQPMNSQRRPLLPMMGDDLQDDDDDITIVTLTPRLDLLAAVAEGRLPDASNRDEDDEERVIDSTRASAVPIIYDEDAAEDEPTRAHAVILVSAVGQTDRGQKRKINEDRYLVLDEHQLYVVADGMGGHAGGEVASQCAVDTIAEAFKKQKFEGEPYEDVPRRGSELALAIQMANRAVYEKARSSPKLTGMGTTIVSARFTHGKQRVYLGHVGDSRCYRFRAGQLTQITTDHTMAAAGMTGPFAEHLSRAVGIAPAVKVDLVIVKPRHEDVFLLCSDGLSKMVKDDAIREVLATHSDPDEAANVLVERANAGGGRDNITVILVVVKDPKGFARYMQDNQRKRKAPAVVSDLGEITRTSPSAVSGPASPDGEARGVSSEATVEAEAKGVVPEAIAASTSADTRVVVVEAPPISADEKVPSEPSPDAKEATAEATVSAPPSRPSSPPSRPSVPPAPSAPSARPSAPEGRVSVIPARPSSPAGSRPSTAEVKVSEAPASPVVVAPAPRDSRPTDVTPVPAKTPPPSKKKH